MKASPPIKMVPREAIARAAEKSAADFRARKWALPTLRRLGEANQTKR